MARKKPPKVLNQCPDRDVSKPLARKKAVQPTSAHDLTDDQIEQLHRVTRGQNMAAACGGFFGFDATEEDAQHLAWVVSINPQWQERLDWEQDYLLREFEQCYGVPRGPHHKTRVLSGGRTEVIDTRTNTVLPLIPYSERRR